MLAWQKEGSRSISKDADTVKTKSGTVRVPGAAEVEYSLTSLVAKGDTTYQDYPKAAPSVSRVQRKSNTP